MQKRITLLAGLDAFRGYGLHAIEIVRGLLKRGYYPAIRPIQIQDCKGASIPADVRSLIVSGRQPEETELLLSPPHNLPTPEKRTIYYTMWESTQIPLRSVELLNRADQVIVPCQWNLENFKASGVNVPISVVPLGIDPKIFLPRPLNTGGPCIFGTAGRSAHGKYRKGVHNVIEVFQAAFRSDENVRLWVKIHPDCELETSDPRIVIHRSLMTSQAIAAWIHGLTCFVSGATGEGWGLWQQQALSCGRPIIAAQYGGLRHFFGEGTGWPVHFTEQPAREGYKDCGLWAEPDWGGMIDAMRDCYANRNEAAQRGERAGSVRPITWDMSLERLVAVIENQSVPELTLKPLARTRPAPEPYQLRTETGVQVMPTFKCDRLPIEAVTVDIVMPFKGDDRYLEESWRSIVRQTHQRWRLYLIDGNTKPSWKATQIASDERVTYIHAPEKSLVQSLNAGIATGKSPLVARMDGDDVMHQDRLRQQIEVFAHHPEIDILGTQMDVFDNESGRIVRRTNHPKRVTMDIMQDSGWSVNHPTVMFRRASMDQIGGYREIGAAEDLDCWMRALRSGLTIRNMEPSLLLYRQHGTQKSQTDKMAMRQVVESMRAESVPKVKVGFVAKALVWGGAERWLLDLIDSTEHAVEWVFVKTTDAIGNVMRQEMESRRISSVEKECDVVLIWHPDLPRRYTAKVIQMSHSVDCDPFVEKMTEKSLSGVSVAVAPSRVGTEIFRKCGVEESRIRIIANGFRCGSVSAICDHDEWRFTQGFTERDFIVGYMGRFAHTKGTRLVFEAAALFDVQTRLLVCGQGESEERLLRAAMGNAHCLGWIGHTAEFLNGVDCLVIASHYECFPNVLAEAWMAGCPVISTNVGIAKEHPEFVTHLPFDATPRVLAEVIESIKRSDRVEITKRAQVFAMKHYSLARFSEDWIALFREVAQD